MNLHMPNLPYYRPMPLNKDGSDDSSTYGNEGRKVSFVDRLLGVRNKKAGSDPASGDA